MADRNKLMSHTRNWTRSSAACVLNKTEEEKHCDITDKLAPHEVGVDGSAPSLQVGIATSSGVPLQIF